MGVTSSRLTVSEKKKIITEEDIKKTEEKFNVYLQGIREISLVKYPKGIPSDSFPSDLGYWKIISKTTQHKVTDEKKIRHDLFNRVGSVHQDQIHEAITRQQESKGWNLKDIPDNLSLTELLSESPPEKGSRESIEIVGMQSYEYIAQSGNLPFFRITAWWEVASLSGAVCSFVKFVGSKVISVILMGSTTLWKTMKSGRILTEKIVRALLEKWHLSTSLSKTIGVIATVAVGVILGAIAGTLIGLCLAGPFGASVGAPIGATLVGSIFALESLDFCWNSPHSVEEFLAQFD